MILNPGNFEDPPETRAPSQFAAVWTTVKATAETRANALTRIVETRVRVFNIPDAQWKNWGNIAALVYLGLATIIAYAREDFINVPCRDLVRSSFWQPCSRGRSSPRARL
jgi:hypothetical protein